MEGQGGLVILIPSISFGSTIGRVWPKLKWALPIFFRCDSGVEKVVLFSFHLWLEVRGEGLVGK